jgi:hypothetical protein
LADAARSADMKTVPLHGKIARGRVALVDDEDYELVIQYRWYVRETLRGAGKRNSGPYAVTMIGSKQAGTRTSLGMHNLITGISGIDHRDHNGLNNQRYNLRPATDLQNLRNTRGRLGFTSEYKGVYWSKQKRRWHALITIDGHGRHLGFYISDTEAALAYDDAAREHFGEFACLNFPEGVPQAVRDQFRAEREAADAERHAEARRVHDAKLADWWEQRTHEARVCTVCETEYLTKATRPTLYCSGACSATAKRRRDREKRPTVRP